jgi:hypothetical protein
MLREDAQLIKEMIDEALEKFSNKIETPKPVDVDEIAKLVLDKISKSSETAPTEVKAEKETFKKGKEVQTI